MQQYQQYRYTVEVTVDLAQVDVREQPPMDSAHASEKIAYLLARPGATYRVTAELVQQNPVAALSATTEQEN